MKSFLFAIFIYFAAFFAQAAENIENYRTCQSCDKAELTAFFDQTDKPYEAFQLVPANPTGKVAVLFHGMSDSPYYMKDFARLLYQNGFRVIVPLMKAHGNVYEGLERVEANDFLMQGRDVLDMASQFGDELIVGGFSNGGLLASRLAAEEKYAHRIKALLLSAPALRLPLKYAVLGHALNLLKEFSRIVQISSVKNLYSRFLQFKVSKDGCRGCSGPVRYSDIPLNGLVQVHKGINKLNGSLAETQIAVPTFMLMSAMDKVVDVQRVAKFFAKNFVGPKHLFWIDSEKSSKSPGIQKALSGFNKAELTRVTTTDDISHSATPIEEPGLAKSNEVNTQMSQVKNSVLEMFFRGGKSSCHGLFL